MTRGIEFSSPEDGFPRRMFAVVPFDARDPRVAREKGLSPGIYAMVGPVRSDEAEEDIELILECAGDTLAGFIFSEGPIADAGGSQPISDLNFGLKAVGFTEDKTRLLVKFEFKEKRVVQVMASLLFSPD